MNTHIVLKKGKAKPFWAGNPLVFSGAIERVVGQPEPGDLVSLADHGGTVIGTGVFNPHSQYRVRLLALEGDRCDSSSIDALVARRVADALALRSALGLPSDSTTAFRVLNSEGDRCSGLTIDLFADVAVVASSAFWTERHRPALTAALEQSLKPRVVVWRQVRSALSHDGWTAFSAPADQPPASLPVEILEHGIRYRIDAGKGQKTGFYCDQRDNRLLVRSVAKNRRVLDLYCYSGGFSLNAAAGGASSVRGVDSSAQAIEAARANAALNNAANVEFVTANVQQELAAAAGYDFIIIDPPKLAPSAGHAPRALKLYRSLAAAALGRLPAHGLLLLCSCSAAVMHADLVEALRDASLEAGVRPAILTVTHHPADHPVLAAFTDGAYQSAVLAAKSNG